MNTTQLAATCRQVIIDHWKPTSQKAASAKFDLLEKIDAALLAGDQGSIAQQPAQALPDELRVKAETFVTRMRKGAAGDRAAERELESEDADAAQACAVQAFIQEGAAAMVEQLLAAAPAAPVAQGQWPSGCPCNSAPGPCENCSPAAEQPDTVAVPRELYTCIGKGGRYELLGHSSGAGGCRREGRIVYRCLDTGQLYHRTDDDFAARMAPLTGGEA